MVPAVTRREHDTAGPMHSPSAFSYGQANLRLLTLASIFITTTTTIWQHIMMMWLVDQRPSRAHVPVAHPPYWPSILPLRPVIAKPEHQFRLWNLQIENVRSNIVLPDYCDHKHWPYSQTRCACALSSYNRKWQPSWMLVMHCPTMGTISIFLFSNLITQTQSQWGREKTTQSFGLFESVSTTTKTTMNECSVENYRKITSLKQRIWFVHTQLWNLGTGRTFLVFSGFEKLRCCVAFLSSQAKHEWMESRICTKQETFHFDSLRLMHAKSIQLFCCALACSLLVPVGYLVGSTWKSQ